MAPENAPVIIATINGLATVAVLCACAWGLKIVYRLLRFGTWREPMKPLVTPARGTGMPASGKTAASSASSADPMAGK